MLNSDETAINSLSADNEVTTRPVKTGERIPLLLRKRLFRNFFNFSHRNEENNGYVEFENHTEVNGRTLGTFAGVFCPVALSMFSALLFLRVGFIVGNAGLLLALTQFVIAYLILIFTVSSICAISTNGAVEGGGAYFMISRTLGPEFGGSIGTLFFLANIVSSALYITGCVEGFVENFGPGGYLVGGSSSFALKDGAWWRFLYGSCLNFLNLLVCLLGSSIFAKTSVSILGIVCISLLSSIVSFLCTGASEIPIPMRNNLVQNDTFHVNGTYTGFNLNTLTENLYANYSKDYTSGSNSSAIDFAAVFGVLFSGVTGIMAGANMSGELKEPSKSIPFGTLSAVAFTFFCYIIMSLLSASTTSRFLLQNNYIFLMGINFWPPFITIGILTATFSASLSNFIGSSRVLEALAKDSVYGFLFNFISKGTYKGNPIAAVFVSFALVEITLLLGSLNLIAQINSILFLLSYLATNLACLGLEVASAPNFRPTFIYFSWHTAFLGLASTVIMMFVINLIYALLSVILCLVLIICLHLFSPSRKYQWGSISQALIFHQVRKYLLLLDPRKEHVKFWRPQILLLVNNPRTCCPLISFVNDIKKGGLYVIGHVQSGSDFLDIDTDTTIDEYPYWLSLVDNLKVKAFVELTVAKSVRDGFHHLVRISGMGAMKPNTIFLGFYDDEMPVDFFGTENPYSTKVFHEIDIFQLRNMNKKSLTIENYAGIISDVIKMKKNLCICRRFQILEKITSKSSNTYIDVWPINFFSPNPDNPFGTTSLFMFQLACILNMVSSWKRLKLRIFLCDNNSESLPGSESRLKQLLLSLRIQATIHRVFDWSNCYSMLPGGSIYSENCTENKCKIYFKKINQLIRELSDRTSCLFMYLPTEFYESQNASNHKTYLQYLTDLTEDLPPTVFVHGVHGVTNSKRTVF
ncbi:cation chloride cotransporter, putative [Pediculus humanus corporis]|uniref:Solute carrier family 12 member 9 n=1 Tax=Pediculus humanus subsp. corporis TaxID=121224 RepID=E0VL18_PEDHC|nr:cation chloride cotransporter, putative [Pediculus humanus corporis]EEB14074.1 cation chloride cotransporter, putative [Pediculus humanus corporis]